MAIQLRPLRRDEVEQIWTIDRAELIERIYVLRDGELVLIPARFEAAGWPPGHPERYTPLLYQAFDRGADLTGAFDGGVLAGVAIVDTPLVGPRRDLLQLLFLHVSRAYRGHGLGARLFRHACAVARARGAPGLYISATPSDHTIGFYQQMGCTLLPEPDPALFAMEPEDIHLEHRPHTPPSI